MSDSNTEEEMVIFWKRKNILILTFLRKDLKEQDIFFFLYVFFRENQPTETYFDVQYLVKKNQGG